MFGPVRVLVVDDDPQVRSSIFELLEAFGFTAKVAPNGRAALKLCERACPFDIVLADVVMPEIGGVQLAEMLGDQYPSLPVILMTGRDSMIESVVDAGAVALFKPFTALQLKRIIDEATSRDDPSSS